MRTFSGSSPATRSATYAARFSVEAFFSVNSGCSFNIQWSRSSSTPLNTRFSDLVKGAMSAYDREPAGEAVIGVEGGSSIRVPYFVWSRTVGTQTKHALMYSVVHGDGFVNVQVESSRPFTDQQLAWFTTKLRLLELPVVVEDNGSPVEGAGAAEGT